MLRKIRPLSFTGVRSAALCVLAASLSYNIVASGQDTSRQYLETKLVSNIPGEAAVHDPNLVNAWGLARSSGSPWWVADNGKGLSTLYDGAGAIQGLVVTIPPVDPKSPPGNPTGIVFNGDPKAFLLAPGKPAIFIFVTEDGTISGWNPGVNPTVAKVVVNETGESVYKGVTIATATIRGKTGSYLYVADFRQGRVQIYDSTFHHVAILNFKTTDPTDDDGSATIGFAPFNVQNIGGEIYVAYAMQDAARHDEVDGAGLGVVKIYTPEGKWLRDFQHGNFLNAPWGMVLAPSDFGAFSHNLLVGQFGSGQIAAFDIVTGGFLGLLQDNTGKPLTIDGLWALSPGNDQKAGPATSVFFSAGPNGEKDGLFGTLTAVSNPQGSHQ
jgi:uncharacterized protein (TIGR03118 family)